MKIKSTLVAVMVAALALSSCAKENVEGTNVPTEGKDVLLLIESDEDGTRAEAEDVKTKALTMGAGHIFFTDAAGTIKRHIKMVTTVGVPADEIAIPTVGTPVTLTNIPSSAEKCYIVSNAAITMPAAPIVNRNISEILSLTVSVASMYDGADANKGVGKVPIVGEGTLNKVPTPATVAIQMKAVGARIQIAKFEGKTDIVSYEVEGIFINNYFAAMPISKSLTGAPVDNGSTATKYVGSSTEYPAAFPLYDYDATKLGKQGLTVKDVVPVNTGSAFTDPVWAYNVFPTEGHATPLKTNLPRIIVRMKNIVYTDGGGVQQTLAGPQFLTVNGYNDGTSLTQLKAGYVYTIRNLEFERKNLNIIPQETDISATVTISQLAWIPSDVTPEF